MKIKKIQIQNLKAVKDLDIDLNGCSIMVTGGNNKGKTTALQDLVARFQGAKPKTPVSVNEKKGTSKMTFVDGSSVEWKFTEKTENFVYTTSDGIEMKTGVLRAIGSKFFGTAFNIDKFLASSSNEQVKTLTALLGVDLTKIDADYKIAYKSRTECNAVLKNHIANIVAEPEEVEKVSADNTKLLKAQDKNLEIKADWDKKNKLHRKEIRSGNDKINKIAEDYKRLESDLERLDKIGKKWEDSYSIVLLGYKSSADVLNGLPKLEPITELTDLPAPELIDLTELTEKFQEDSKKESTYNIYLNELSAYEKWVSRGKELRTVANEADQSVKSIEASRKQSLVDAHMPDGFEIIDGAIMYNGFSLDSISTSSKYIAALKLGKFGLGALQTLHFDASFLDNNSLKEVKEWANSEDLQLLIERPAMDGGEIKYNIIEEK